MDDDSSSDSEEEPVEEPVSPRFSPLLIMDDDSSSDSEEEPVPPPAHSCYTIYIPTFLDEALLLSNMLITDLNAELLKKNRLTPELVRGIESCFPTKEEISNTAEGDNIRDLVAFKVKAAKLHSKMR